MTAPALDWSGVSRRFGGTLALDGVTLAVPAGQFVALVGQSGSGKSTLLRTVNRLVEPDAGRVMLDGEAVTAVPAPLLRRRIGFVFQDVGLFPHLDVAENIALPARVAARAAPDVAALLAQVELSPELAERRPDELSGGQRQRVGVARALSTGARLMLMDEPFGALDPITRDALGRTVRDLHDRLGLTSVMVTHDMAEALLLADRIVVLAGGRIVADATPAALLAGEGGAAAAALVAVPRAQAERLAAMAASVGTR